jgi:hypothetical protein
MVEEELNKPTFKPKFVSEYSMGQYDFDRYNQWLKYIEQWSSEINSTDIPTLTMVQHLFSGLNVLWKNWRPIVAIPDVIKKVDDKIKESKHQKRVWENSNRNNSPLSEIIKLKLIDNLDEIYTKIMEIKQVIGLGIIVRKNMTTREKIRMGVRGDRDFSSLPEA